MRHRDDEVAAAHASELGDRVGGAVEMLEDLEAENEVEAAVREELKGHFRPEFLNRIDEVVVFHRLSREHLRGIVDLQARYLQQRLAQREMVLTLSDAAKDRLAAEGYDPVYGARPLKRVIQQMIENPLAKRILAGEFGPGDRISVNANGEGFTFDRHAAAVPV